VLASSFPVFNLGDWMGTRRTKVKLVVEPRREKNLSPRSTEAEGKKVLCAPIGSVN